jgi:hypothetical protein
VITGLFVCALIWGPALGLLVAAGLAEARS